MVNRQCEAREVEECFLLGDALNLHFAPIES